MASVDAMVKLQDVADGVLVATHPFWTTTTTVVVGDDDACLIVDPAVMVEEIDALAADLDRRGLRVAAGFATHPHWDHLLWRASLGDAPRYATAAAAEATSSRLDHNVEQSAAVAPGHDPSVFTRVTALDSGARSLPWTGRRVDVVEHRAHAPGHAAVYLPDVRVLIAGDMVSDLEIPLPDHAAADPLGDYDAALDLFETLPVDVVVPGHGAVGDGDEFRRRLDLDRRYLAAARSGRGDDDPRLAAAEDWLLREHAATIALSSSPSDR
jgi:glyoxylase-like metal-dependent hydrolase (beta-lactamase superfamily II)